jgi:dihydroorotate dehydrogenase electron transfer subunit
LESQTLAWQTLSEVVTRTPLAPGLVVITFKNGQIAHNGRAGQFVNVLPKIGAVGQILRRPFSVYQRSHDLVSIIVQVAGRGTELIAATQPGEMLDVLGPLGQPWKFDSDDFQDAILVIGGVGVASMPLLTEALSDAGKKITTYYGARNGRLFAKEGLVNLELTTDDGSEGFHGMNITLLDRHLTEGRFTRAKLFVCGPTGMMRAAKALAEKFDVLCELSLETEMACGIGICQGCPVVTDEATFAATGKRFRLVCTEGPSFLSKLIEI